MPEDYQTNAAGQNADHHSTKYRFEEAIGDLVDNSIDAKATTIDVYFGDQDLVAAGSPAVQGRNEFTYPDGLGFLHDASSAFLIVADNGTGMSANEFRNAVIKGQRRHYEEYELGHFGVGLKKSTMSQCYEATIFTKKNGQLSIKRISSVHIQESGKDQLLNDSDFKGTKAWMANTEGYKTSLDIINGRESGTVILLEGLHKIEKSIGSITVADRVNFVNDIKNRIKAYLGVIFERYIEGGHEIPLTNGKTHIIPKVDIRFSAISVLPIDPFFKKYKKPGHNRWTLDKTLGGLKTFLRIPGKPVKDIPMNSTLYIIPTEKDALSNPGSKFIEENLLKSKAGLKRPMCQGIYLYRNQRLIEFASEDAWRGLLPTHNSNALGRWEVFLPPHLPPNLTDLDFTLDSTKTESSIGQKTLDGMKKLMSKKYTWHTRDSTSLKLTDRFQQRKEKPTPYETNCSDCGAVGHFSKVAVLCPLHVTPPCVDCGTTGHKNKTDPKCKHYVAVPAVPVPPVPHPPPVPPVPPSPGAGSHTVSLAKTGDLVEVKGTDIIVNETHTGFSDLEYWFKNK